VAIPRIVLGIVFFAHGAQKMLGWYGGPGLASSMRTFTEHLHLPSTLAFLVIAGELLSGIGLIVGLFSRIAALVIALTIGGRYCNGSFPIRPPFELVWKPRRTRARIPSAHDRTGPDSGRPRRGSILIGSHCLRTCFGAGTIHSRREAVRHRANGFNNPHAPRFP
jgi:hypothetical protein